MTEPLPSNAPREIRLDLIEANANNFRKTITQEMIYSLASSIQADGLKNPLKVILLPNGTYQLVSGHVRLAAAKKLGMESLPALILDLTPEQAMLEAILDNRDQTMNWLDLYISIENLLWADPNLTEQEVADQLDASALTVNRAVKLLRILSDAARCAIGETLTRSGSYQVSEAVVFRLTELGEDPSPIEAALRQVIDKKMTEPEVEKLIGWIKAGNKAETFGKPSFIELTTPNSKARASKVIYF